MIEYLLESGVNFVLFLQGLGEWLFSPMKFFSFLGQEEFFLLFMPALYWSIDAALGIRVGVILLLSSGLNTTLKHAFHSPRPYWYSPEVHAGAAEGSFGIPSGHAQNSAAVWGVMAAVLRKTWAWALCGSLIFLIGLSRLVLGVHFPVDVVLGWVFGFFLVWLFLRLESPVKNWLAGQRLPVRLLSAFAVSLGLVLLGLLVRAGIGGFQIPAAWVENAAAGFPGEPIQPLNLSDLFTSAGSLFGFAAGAIWLYAGRGFDASGSLGQRLLRYLIGIGGVIALRYGLGVIFPRGEYLLAYVLRYLRYFLIGLWISALAPFVFIRLKLAKPRNQ